MAASWSGAGARRDRVLLVAVAEDELAGADRPPAAVLERRALARAAGRRRCPRSTGWAKPSAKPKCSVPPGSAEPGLVADHGDPAVALDRLAQHRVARGQRGRVLGADHHQHVDLAAAERRLPVLRGALADVAQRSRRAPPSRSGSRRGSRPATCRDAERLEPGIGEGDVDPRLGLRLPRVGGQHVRRRLGQQRAGARRVVDAQEQVARGGQPVAADHEALDRVELERLGHDGNSAWKRACSSAGGRPCAAIANSISRVRRARLAWTWATVWSP